MSDAYRALKGHRLDEGNEVVDYFGSREEKEDSPEEGEGSNALDNWFKKQQGKINDLYKRRANVYEDEEAYREMDANSPLFQEHVEEQTAKRNMMLMVRMMMHRAIKAWEEKTGRPMAEMSEEEFSNLAGAADQYLTKMLGYSVPGSDNLLGDELDPEIKTEAKA